MALSTSSLRSAWAPPCRGPWHEIRLNGAGRVSVRPAITEAVLALNAELVRFGYLTRYADTGAQNCRRITGGTAYSLHAYGIALDINWMTNPYGRRLRTDFPPAMRAAILSIRTNSGEQVWGWGGNYGIGGGNFDAMHWEVVCAPRALASGIRGRSAAPAPRPVPVPPPAPVAPAAKPPPNPIPTHPLEDTSMPADISFHQPPAQPNGQPNGVFMFRNGVRFGVRTPTHLEKLQKIAQLNGADPTVHQDDWDTFMFLSCYAVDGDPLSPK